MEYRARSKLIRSIIVGIGQLPSLRRREGPNLEQNYPRRSPGKIKSGVARL